MSANRYIAKSPRKHDNKLRRLKGEKVEEVAEGEYAEDSPEGELWI